MKKKSLSILLTLSGSLPVRASAVIGRATVTIDAAVVK